MYLHGHFYNQKEERIEVHVLTGGDRTKEIVIGEKNGELSFTDDPVDLTSQVNDTFDHLLCQQATVRLLARNFVPDFFCASCRDAVVNIYREGKCLFAGFIEPQSYSQGYNEEFDEIELSCIDALTALQYAKYRDVGSLGVLYNVVKAEAEQRTFLAMLKEILGGVTAELDIVGGNAMRYLYDGSKAVDDLAGNRYAIFGQLTVSELLFMGDEEDDVWQQDEVLEEILKYLNLHIVQDGFTFYLFSWESVKGDERIYWRDLLTGASVTTTRQTTDIVTGLVTDTDTTISVGEVYNKIMLTAKVESMESVIESPLDNDLLKSPFSNKQKYMTEYSSDGEGSKAINAFDAMTHGQETSYSGGCVTDWYVQMMNNSQWLFPKSGSGNLMEEYCSEGRNQHILPNWLAKNQGAAIMALGKVEKKTDGKDNSPTSKVEMTNYLVVSVNGNCDDKEATTYPNTNSLKAGIPRAVYNGSMTGGVFSPTDEGTTNYIVLSGKLVLNPVMALTDTYKAIYNYDGGIWGNIFSGINKWSGMTVPSRNNGDGRYYTQQWWKAATPNETVVWDMETAHGFVPFTDTGPQLYEFKYSAIGDGSDHISKVGVLACMLIIGDKCVVEKGTEGQVTDFEWRKYKTLEECSSEDEYYQQCFTIGFDPKIGDKIVGTKFDLQNNVNYELGIDAEGIAIPIKKADKVSGRVKFMILGPVNALWDVVTRRHKTWFRHTKWNSTTIPLLAHVSSIMVEQFEVKIYSDNGLVNNTGDNDLVYMSDTKESFVNVKDDIEMKINSALTAAECQALDVTDSVKMSTPLNTLTGEGLLAVYDYSRGMSAKPEQLYVDYYYKEWHAPRVIMTQKLTDTDGGIVSLFAHYRHPMMDKTFFVQGISRNLEEGYAEMTLKEIEQ
ncbi:hypothetical protein [uncultured Prevotella sp.]|uniref:hypothetical protein n=1 Tax=uncultured Prevotella sp. TaxID=159272 RepID=UPI002599041F|nr:hypothetical protein [uncultured Prevotella sp.]